MNAAVQRAIIPENEPQRIAAVKRYDILDTPPDGCFDRITAIAARRFNVPISIVSLVDSDRIWFKSRHGLEVQQIDRDPGLCASAILTDEPHILPDARIDARSLANPLVAGEFGLRFYAGVPLTTSDGYNLGTLCVIDKAPRTVDQRQIDDLVDLASVVMDQMELRLAARRSAAQAQLMTREIDHRVMNSLQFISTLLSMQTREGFERDARTQLQMAANRVRAVAQVHRHFHSGDADHASLGKFLRGLCADLSSIIGKEVRVRGGAGDVSTLQILPIGLIVNELVTNAAKHARGRIEIIHEFHGGVHEISVCDDGAGLAPDFDQKSSPGLGMKIIATLLEQLRGEMSVGPNADGSGSCFKVAFPA